MKTIEFTVKTSVDTTEGFVRQRYLDVGKLRGIIERMHVRKGLLLGMNIGSGEATLTFSLDSNPTCLYIFGLYLNTDTGIIYLNPAYEEEMIQLTTIQDMFGNILNTISEELSIKQNDVVEGINPITTVQEFIIAFQRYKLANDEGALMKDLFHQFGEVPSGKSIISQYINMNNYDEVSVLSQTTKNDIFRRFVQYVQIACGAIHSLREIYRGILDHSEEAYVKGDPIEEVISLRACLGYYRHKPNVLTISDNVLMDATMKFQMAEDSNSREEAYDQMAYYFYASTTEGIVTLPDHRSDYKDPIKYADIATIMQNNFLDLLEGIEKQNEIIYSSEPTMMLKRYGFDRMVPPERLKGLVATLRKSKQKRSSSYLFRDQSMKDIATADNYTVTDNLGSVMFLNYNKVMRYIVEVQ